MHTLSLFLFNPAPWGSAALGFVMGLLVWYFVARFKAFNAKALGSTASVLTGGALTKLLEWNNTSAPWYYPIGLFVATLIYWLAVLAGPEGGKYLKEDL